jgi:rhodanese-related sulfurtransferase
MKAMCVVMIALLLALDSAAGSSEEIPFPDVSRVTPKAARSMLGEKDVVILDVRPEEQWSVADMKIARAAHGDPKKIGDWIKKYSPTQTVILYCA